MKQVYRLAGVCIIVFGFVQLLGSRLQAQNRYDSSVCFYTDENYRGESYCVDAGESRRNVGGRFNDRFSSVRVSGGAQVVVFKNEGFSGSRTIFTHSVPNLKNWNDRITSFQVVRGHGGNYGESQSNRDYGGYGSGNEPRDGACFYVDKDFRGNRVCLSTGERIRNVEDRYNDRITSIRVFGRARVVIYKDENFSGARRNVNKDVRNLGDFNDRLTSIEIR